MNSPNVSRLPEYRRAIYGRTYSQTFKHADYAGIERHRVESRFERIAGVALAIVIGVGLAASLVAWWAA